MMICGYHDVGGGPWQIRHEYGSACILSMSASKVSRGPPGGGAGNDKGQGSLIRFRPSKDQDPSIKFRPRIEAHR